MTGAGSLPGSIGFGRAICGDLDAAERREWWLSNGTGAYAAGTVAGTLTRRYHGLLIAPVHPPLGRVLVVAKADARLTIDDGTPGSGSVALFGNRWADSISPQGHLDLESFRLVGRMPSWRFRAGAHTLEMRIWMEPGADTSYVAYRLEAPSTAVAHLDVTFLVNARDHHGNTRAGEFAFDVSAGLGTLRVSHAGEFSLEIAGAARFFPSGSWYENFDLPAERARGLPDRDNHFCPGRAALDLLPGQWTGLSFSLSPGAGRDIAGAMQRFHAHDAIQLQGAGKWAVDAPEWIRQLILAADSFVISRPLAKFSEGESVIAGYPWFGDWGRDTMISLPGLTLATGRLDSARRILMTFAHFVDEGQLPNVFPGQGTETAPEYNSADAALWFVEAWRAYAEASGDLESLVDCWPALEEIVQCHVAGTRFGIGVDPNDGLLRAGVAGVQLTWMDAKVGDWVVTPRTGKPVEINALWFNALSAMSYLGTRIGVPVEAYRSQAEKTRQGFQRFINPGGGLYDVLDGPDGRPDPRVRPNQIFAVSLPYSPIDRDCQRAVVECCARELLTSYGLRTLAPTDPAYIARYAGDPSSRDGSYHQGTVWPWLLGHFAVAEYRAKGDLAVAQGRLAPLADHLSDAGTGTISEILDAAPPHFPRGAPAQAWSVACTLDAWWKLHRASEKDRLIQPQGGA